MGGGRRCEREGERKVHNTEGREQGTEGIEGIRVMERERESGHIHT